MENEKLLAWFGDPALKERVVLKMKEHRARDEFAQGTYQDFYDKSGAFYVYPDDETQVPHDSTFKGCAIGCTLPPISLSKLQDEDFNWHKEVERQYGIKSDVGWLIDEFFEGMSSFEEAAQFAVDVIEAIPVGADLSEFDLLTYDFASGAARFIQDLRNAPVPDATKSI